MSYLTNLTPHAIHIVGTDGTTLLHTYAAGHELRLLSQEQVAISPMLDVAVAPVVPLITGQYFKGIDTTGAGYKAWEAKPMGNFIVSLPMAIWLTKTQAGQELTGERQIFAPATGPGYVVRDDKGRITGVRALEFYATSDC